MPIIVEDFFNTSRSFYHRGKIKTWWKIVSLGYDYLYTHIKKILAAITLGIWFFIFDHHALSVILSGSWSLHFCRITLSLFMLKNILCNSQKEFLDIMSDFCTCFKILYIIFIPFSLCLFFRDNLGGVEKFFKAKRRLTLLSSRSDLFPTRTILISGEAWSARFFIQKSTPRWELKKYSQLISLLSKEFWSVMSKTKTTPSTFL